MPQFADEFGLSVADGGHIASIAFSAFMVALPITAIFVFRLGPRTPVILACLMACAGSVLVATASNATMLTAGIVIAGSSAGLCWTPFNDAARHSLTEDRRNTALSIIATGTATQSRLVSRSLAMSVINSRVKARRSPISFASSGETMKRKWCRSSSQRSAKLSPSASSDVASNIRPCDPSRVAPSR
uniref:MFS transporter n=1 Tax=Qipengyuania sp. GPGPB31 TaxID=3023518 RepID=UPI004053B0A4